MNVYHEVVVAMVFGMAVGFTGPLVVGWFKALVTGTAAVKKQEPAQGKAKRSYKRKVTSDGTAVTAITSSTVTKKQRGLLADAKASAKKIRSNTVVVDITKNRRGRPTNAELAARKDAAEKLVKSTTDVGSTLTENPAIADKESLLEKLLQLSPEQLHALQSMPIGKATLVPAKESLAT